jgi:hypothetical protein
MKMNIEPSCAFVVYWQVIVGCTLVELGAYLAAKMMSADDDDSPLE